MLSVAQRLQAEVRVLCLVLTYPGQHRSRALPVHLTWARRCSQVYFITNNATSHKEEEEEEEEEDEERKKRKRRRKEEEEEAVRTLPFLFADDADEGKSGLWEKTKFAFSHAHRNHLEDFEWFLKADDDTYVIMENLRYFLHDKDPELPHYFGSHFTPYAPKGYMSGGAGYVLSRGALKAFQRQTDSDSNNINNNNNNNNSNTIYTEEDVEMGGVLARAGVYPGDSRDQNGLPRFFPFYPSFLLAEKEPEFWYWKTLAHDHTTGLGCCSPHTVSFHYEYGDLLYELEFLIYHLKLFGVDGRAEKC
ncbi:glycoprotein-N-acetylgalactosamine 3-beta-galactosyltransferase 1-like [Eriocheir sinensis]|uniref:glycoprotein-N-acetylgalactosamine 3-beta-galactosyltransferase 1-like n=1 Tax=Eriocheir sinensis TaxID=95602 RepID=UPI0021CAC148|nr:glycoprotein-N-acetylgalactosamine 3-beta-galactosyltransferase 1-like [Eriocheir sinensis]